MSLSMGSMVAAHTWRERGKCILGRGNSQCKTSDPECLQHAGWVCGDSLGRMEGGSRRGHRIVMSLWPLWGLGLGETGTLERAGAGRGGS